MDNPASILEAVKLIKDWAIWVTGIQTGAIAVLGSLMKDGVSRTPPQMGRHGPCFLCVIDASRSLARSPFTFGNGATL